MNSIEEKIKIHKLFYKNENRQIYGQQLVFNAYENLTMEEFEKVYKEITSSINHDFLNKRNYLFKVLYSIFFTNLRTPTNNEIKTESKKNIIKKNILKFIKENKNIESFLFMEYLQHQYKTDGFTDFEIVNLFKMLNENFDSDFFDSRAPSNLFQSLLISSNPNNIEEFLNVLDQEDINDAVDLTKLFSNKIKEKHRFLFSYNRNDFIRFINFNHIKMKKAKESLVKRLNEHDEKIEIENSYFIINNLEQIIFFIQNEKRLLNAFLAFIKKNIIIKGDISTHVHSPDFSSLVILSSIIKEITSGTVKITTDINTDLFDYIKKEPPLKDLSLEELKIMNENKDENLYRQFKKVNIQDYEL